MKKDTIKIKTNKKKQFLVRAFFSFMFLLLNATDILAKEFYDVPSSFWGYSAINELTDKGIFDTNENYFYPNKLITRSEYATILVKALGQEYLSIEKKYTFEDLNQTNKNWRNILRAISLDIIKPFDNNHFYPDGNVTRTEIIFFLDNILKTEEFSKKEALSVLEKNYDDYEDIPDWLKLSAGRIEILNVIANDPAEKNMLNCDKYITRAQMAVFVNNLVNKLKEYEQDRIQEETSPKTVNNGIIIEDIVQNKHIVTIPTGTMLPVRVFKSISSKHTKEGQIIKAKFPDDIINNQNQMLFSKDTILTGKILKISKAKYGFKNGSVIMDFFSINNNGNLTEIIAYKECTADIIEANKIKAYTRKTLKGIHYNLTDNEIIYIRVLRPIRINVVTGDILD